MAVGGFYIDKRELDEFEHALMETAGKITDLTKVYRNIGKKAGLYVKVHEPIYAGPTKGRQKTVHLQDRTRGGGGKAGAFAVVSGVDYLFLQEFGGSSFWHRGGAGSLRKLNKGHRALSKLGAKGHIVYKKARNPRGYFIWNVAWRLRSFIGRELCTGIQEIGGRYGIAIDITESGLDIPETPKPS